MRPRCCARAVSGDLRRWIRPGIDVRDGSDRTGRSNDRAEAQLDCSAGPRGNRSFHRRDGVSGSANTPSSQGRSSSPDYLKYQLSEKQFADVYTGLQANAVVETKVFFHDLGADGLHPGGETVDIMYERGTKQTIFDRNWKKRGLSESADQKTFRDADARYTRLLTLALEAVRAQMTPSF